MLGCGPRALLEARVVVGRHRGRCATSSRRNPAVRRRARTRDRCLRPQRLTPRPQELRQPRAIHDLILARRARRHPGIDDPRSTGPGCRARVANEDWAHEHHRETPSSSRRHQRGSASPSPSDCVTRATTVVVGGRSRCVSTSSPPRRVSTRCSSTPPTDDSIRAATAGVVSRQPRPERRHRDGRDHARRGLDRRARGPGIR